MSDHHDYHQALDQAHRVFEAETEALQKQIFELKSVLKEFLLVHTWRTSWDENTLNRYRLAKSEAKRLSK